jgi:ABC-type transporter Mla subunit MlaD
VAADSGRLIAGYERLAELGERELELVRTGAYDDLVELNDERDALVATLPANAPLEARAALLRAAAAQAQVEGLLSGLIAHAQASMVRLDKGRQVLSAYAPAAEQRHRVDSSG